ncbi:MAG TPA: xanthine dehydrogenase family protein molybdopterin-binding subunit [Thermoanaerobaculia bacterium]|nr:xanthine dehydrogenase family protein molybdopterin-binding subunit [Thermoanaerobaculia bacterium]
MALIGRSVPRPDGLAKVTGRARYVDDVAEPGVLVGATLRSTVARGRLRGIVRDPSFDWSGLTVVTAENVPANVVALIEEDQPVLASDDVRHAGEPLALVAGEDALRVARALSHLRADIEPLPPVLTVADALQRTAQIYGSDNVFRTVRIAKGDAAAAIASCPVQLSGTYATPHQEHVYLEPQGVRASWDGNGGAHVLSSCQCPYYIHKGIKRTFGLTDERVDVTQAVTGGGFGGKEEYPTILALHALLLARASGRPVKMIYDRKEDIEATTKRHPSVVTVTSGCDRDGTLRAVSIRVILDGGAYVTLSPVVLSRGALHAAGAYRWEHVSIEAQAVATNTPPNGAFRGFGAPQTIWAIERHMDRIARTLRIDPLALRERNLLRVGDTTPTGQFLKESVGVARCVEEAKKASRWDEKRRVAAGAPPAGASGMFRLPPPGAVAARKARGVGASVYLHGAGFTGSGELAHRARVAVDLFSDAAGKPRFRIRGASTDIGQGTETVFRQIAAEALWVSMDRVDFTTPSTAHVPDSGPTVASRTVMIVGGVVEAAARALFALIEGDRQEKGGSFEDAARRLLGEHGSLTVEREYEPPPGHAWDDATYRGDAYPVYGWGCAIAEVEVDLDTFETTVLSLWSAHDVGKAIHPVNCKGQIEGGLLQAVGWALQENVVMREGRVVNARLTDYVIPTILDAPRFTTILVEDPYSRGPGGGAKGLGELPMDGGAPAVAAAVEHATGIVCDRLPLLPEELYALSKEVRR